MPQLADNAPRGYKLPVVQGPKTDAEKRLLDGSLAPADLFSDEQMPAGKVLEDQSQDTYKRKAEGEPLSDLGMNNWDGFNGVADP